MKMHASIHIEVCAGYSLCFSTARSCPAPAKPCNISSPSSPHLSRFVSCLQNSACGHLHVMDFCIHSRLCLHGNVPYKSPILRLLMLIKHGLILAALLHIRIILCNLRTEIKRLYHFIHTFIFCRTPASHVFSPTSTHTHTHPQSK